MTKNKTILLGVAISIVSNLAFFLSTSMKSISKLQYALCFSLPFFIGCILALITLVIKLILRGNYPLNKWDIAEAHNILLNENSFFRKFLAKLYLIVDKPLLFTSGWILGASVFIFFAESSTK